MLPGIAKVECQRSDAKQCYLNPSTHETISRILRGLSFYASISPTVGSVLRPAAASINLSSLPGHLAAWYLLTLSAATIVTSSLGGRRSGWHRARLSWGLLAIIDSILLVLACAGVGSQIRYMEAVCTGGYDGCDSEIRKTQLALGAAMLALARFFSAVRGAMMYRGRDLYSWVPWDRRTERYLWHSFVALLVVGRRKAFETRIESLLVTSRARARINSSYDEVDPEAITVDQRWNIDVLRLEATQHRALRTSRFVERIFQAEQSSEQCDGAKGSIRRKSKSDFEDWIGARLEFFSRPRRSVWIESELEAIRAVETSASVINCPRWLTSTWLPKVSKSSEGRLAAELEILAQMVLITQETGDRDYYDEMMETIPTYAWKVKVDAWELIKVALATFHRLKATTMTKEDHDAMEKAKDEFILLFRQVVAACILLAAESSMCVSQADLAVGLKHVLRSGQDMWRKELQCQFSHVANVKVEESCFTHVLQNSAEDKYVSTLLLELENLEKKRYFSEDSGFLFRTWI